MAPIKALCQQVATNWGRRFGRIGLRCFELTGDTDPNDVPELCTYNIVLTTPEKWDSVTRRWKDHSSFVENVSLLLIDEVHLLGSGRGATLEAVVSRMKGVRADKCRIVALSATIPNVEDIATWIGVPEEGVVCVGDEFRPVHVDVHVIGYQSAKNDYIFDRNLNYKLASIIMQYGDGRPVLIVKEEEEEGYPLLVFRYCYYLRSLFKKIVFMLLFFSFALQGKVRQQQHSKSSRIARKRCL